MSLERELIEFLMVKGAEFWCQITEGPDQRELGRNDGNDKTKPSLIRKLEVILEFTLHLSERISRGKQIRVQDAAAVRRISEVAGLTRRLERPTYQVAAGPDMFRPWRDITSEEHIRPGLEALQSAFFDQFIGELAEAKCCRVITKIWPDHHAERYVCVARTVAVAVLEAQINRPTDR